MGPNLPVELVVRHEVDVLDDVVIADDDGGPVGLEVVDAGLAQLFRDDGEVQAEVLDVSLVRLQIEQVLVEFGIERREVVDVDVQGLLSEQLREEKARQWKLYQVILVQALSENWHLVCGTSPYFRYRI